MTDPRTGEPRIILRTCKLPLPCPDCDEVRASAFARDDFGRVALIRRQHPECRFAFVTIKPGESEDLRGQVLALFDLFRALLRLEVLPFDKVLGAVLQIHPQRGRGGRWRAHGHAIVAIDYPGGGLEEWFQSGASAETARRRLSKNLGGAVKWHVAKFFRSKHQDLVLLEQLQMTPEWEAYRRSEYSASLPILTVADSLHALEALFGVNLRRTYGAFRGASPETLRGCWEEALRAQHVPITEPSPHPQNGKGIDSEGVLRRFRSTPFYVAWKQREEEGKRELMEQLLEERRARRERSRAGGGTPSSDTSVEPMRHGLGPVSQSPRT